MAGTATYMGASYVAGRWFPPPRMDYAAKIEGLQRATYPSEPIRAQEIRRLEKQRREDGLRLTSSQQNIVAAYVAYLLGVVAFFVLRRRMIVEPLGRQSSHVDG